MRLILLILLAPLLAVAQRQVENPKYKTRQLPTEKQWKEVQNSYNNTIPVLEYAQQDLEHTVVAKQAFKCIHNADTTRFIAFFVDRVDSEHYKFMDRFSGGSRMEYERRKTDTIHYYGYMLWGMKYEGKWYFDKDKSVTLHAANLSEAQDIYLFDALVNIEYFKYIKDFWEGKKDNPLAIATDKNTHRAKYRIPYLGKPLIIENYTLHVAWMREEARDEKALTWFTPAADSLWAQLHRTKPFTCNKRFEEKYHDNKRYILLSPNRDKALVPIVYYDGTGRLWLEYYYIAKTTSGGLFYKWNKIPRKECETALRREFMIINNDIRTLVPDWKSTKRQAITDEAFWQNNFNDTDIQAIQ
ncbi:hypothetical protein AM493_02685 [Flavobacterium akiainvivens]|uniref:Uncharacterized protein n=1 Tax=Flavobacterium akiainvivens TaxID=1202724 RepID=A0A0M9VH10_9FLAO|nr:hypothetical protein [Flavobacterium akiainvivens]KOS05060.1 hypothetical protein AM493_02685 [Flavobacterium akiainvivens]SFQ52069.1 hypothetical protein SAMN05444144_106267 [Flavobacterium akiainvivens]